MAGLGALALMASAAKAQGGAAPPVDPMATMNATMDSIAVSVDTVWVIVTAVLVFFMQAGFAYVEGGMTRAKNQNNILMKNLLDFCFGTISFFVVGFAFMFGDGNPFIGTSGFLMNGADNSPLTGDAYAGVYSSINWATVPLDAKFLFQLVFAATAATIVSGAMAERTKFSSYLLYSVVISAIIYPISGHWIWGGRLAGHAGLLGFRRQHRRSLGRRVDRFGRRRDAWPAHRQIQQGRLVQRDSGPLDSDGRAGRVHPVAGLVRL